MRILFKINNKLNYYLDSLNIYYLKIIKGINIGENCRISRKASFNCLYGTLTIRSGCIIEENVRIKIVNNVNKRATVVHIDESVFIGYGTIIDAGNQIEIGKYTMIGPYGYITDANHILKEKNVPIAKQGGSFKTTIIEPNCWLGTHVKVLSGVIIGNNSIIAANSTVIKSIEEESLALGTPALIKQKLF